MDVYNSKYARIVGLLYGKSLWAITTSKNTTRYSCSKDMVTPQWKAHEDVHKKQFEKFGYFGFVFRYTWEFIKHGYINNKFEIEARG